MKFLTFTLAGPLVSFGETERWDYRCSGDMPTKSAVIGLLGCCLGLPRGDDKLRQLDERLQMAAYRERSGPLLNDFQTVQSPTGAILNAMRKPRGSTIITPKQYVQDAVFQVFLYGDESALLECEAAMKHPKWVVSLGRRCCPPSVPIWPQLFEADCIGDALEGYVNPLWEAFCQRRSIAREARPRCEVEYAEGMDASRYHGGYRAVRHDAVVRADENRYADREVISFPLKRSEIACT